MASSSCGLDECVDAFGYPGRWLFLTMVLTGFFCWALLEIMERQLGMAPKIVTVDQILEHARTDRDNPVGNFIVNRRLTKTYFGGYRMQTRGTIYYIRFIWSGGLFFVATGIYFGNIPWFLDHFVYFNPDSTNLPAYQHVNACIISFYLWELSANRYGKITWSIIVHHWLTIAAAMQILFGLYSPFATWYGFTIIAMTFPVDLTLAVRATVSNHYPELTRQAFTISFYWWSICLLLNISGQIFLISNALRPSNLNGAIKVYQVVLMCFAMLGWVYDDYQVLSTLRDFATHDYADADILEKIEGSRTRGVKYGRSLLAESIIIDIMDEQKAKVTEMKIVKVIKDTMRESIAGGETKEEHVVAGVSPESEEGGGHTNDDYDAKETVVAALDCVALKIEETVSDSVPIDTLVSPKKMKLADLDMLAAALDLQQSELQRFHEARSGIPSG